MRISSSFVCLPETHVKGRVNTRAFGSAPPSDGLMNGAIRHDG